MLKNFSISHFIIIIIFIYLIHVLIKITNKQNNQNYQNTQQYEHFGDNITTTANIPINSSYTTNLNNPKTTNIPINSNYTTNLNNPTYKLNDSYDIPEGSSYTITPANPNDTIISFTVLISANVTKSIYTFGKLKTYTTLDTTKYDITPGKYGFPIEPVNKYVFNAKVGGSNPIPDNYPNIQKTFKLTNITCVNNIPNSSYTALLINPTTTYKINDSYDIPEGSSYTITANPNDTIISFTILISANVKKSIYTFGKLTTYTIPDTTKYDITPGKYGFPIEPVNKYVFNAKVGGSNPIPDNYPNMQKTFKLTNITCIKKECPVGQTFINNKCLFIYDKTNIDTSIHDDGVSYLFKCDNENDILYMFSLTIYDTNNIKINSYQMFFKKINTYNYNKWTWDGNLKKIPDGIGDPAPDKQKRYQVTGLSCIRQYCSNDQVFMNNTCLYVYSKEDIDRTVYSDHTPYIFTCSNSKDILKSFGIQIYDAPTGRNAGIYTINFDSFGINNVNSWTWNGDLGNIPGIGDPLRGKPKNYSIVKIICIKQ